MLRLRMPTLRVGVVGQDRTEKCSEAISGSQACMQKLGVQSLYKLQ